jgi:UDPglucose--hexose-1-phosphate uridylyltransferase
MQIFENKGAAMGCSNPHPHGQVWTTTGLPEELELELAQQKKYRREHQERHMLEVYAKLEVEQKQRVFYENESFIALCPWWAVWPFEVMILAKTHLRALVDFTDSQIKDLANAISDVTRRYDNLFKTAFPYSQLPGEGFDILANSDFIGMGIHQAPLQGDADDIESSYFHMHFYPPLLRSATVKKFLVG